MADLFTSGSWLGPNEIAASNLAVRLFDWIEMVELDETLKRQLEAGLATYGQTKPRQVERMPLARVRRHLKRRYEKFPYGALIAHEVPGANSRTFEKLAAHCLVAALLIEPRVKTEPKFRQRIDKGLAAARCLSEPKWDQLLKFFGACNNYLEFYEVASSVPAIGMPPQAVRNALKYIKILIGTLLNLIRLPGSSGPKAEFEGYLNFSSQIELEDDEGHYILEIENSYAAPAPDLPFIEVEYTTSADLVHVTQDRTYAPNERERPNRSKDAIARSYYRDQLYLPSSPANLTKWEISQIVEAAKRDLEPENIQFAAAWEILASLLLGRRISDIKMTPAILTEPGKRSVKGPHFRGGASPALMIPAVNTQAVEGTAKIMTPCNASHHTLLLPRILSENLNAYSQAARRRIHSTEDWLKNYRLRGGRRLTQTRLARALRHSLMETGADQSVAGLIVGVDPKVRTGLHYLSLHGAKLQSVYSQALQQLGCPEEFQSSEQDWAGSRVAPTPESQALFYNLASTYLETVERGSVEDLIEFHNRYLAIVVTSLTMLTGHRPVTAPFDTLKSLDLIGNWAAVTDKQIRVTSASRIIPLVSVACQQFEEWQCHVRCLAERLIKVPVFIPGYGRIHFSAAGEATDRTILHCPDGALFFALDLDLDQKTITAKPAQPGRIKDLLYGLWLPGMRGPRHSLRRQATEVDLDSELIDALLGHAAPGSEFFAQWSGHSLGSVERLRKFLEGYSKNIGARVMKGLTD